MISKNEIDSQIALGVAETPQHIAQLVKKTDDADALCWALKHNNTKVRLAAIRNPALPVDMLLHACIFETIDTTREALLNVVALREEEVNAVLSVVQYYPQLSPDLE